VVDVEQVEQLALDARVVDVVHVHAHARIEGLQRIRLADAADEHVDRRGRAAALHDIEVGHRALQAVDGDRLQVAQVLLAEGTDRDRHLLHRFLAPTRGDLDRLEFLGVGRVGRAGLGRRGVRRGVLRPQRRGTEHADDQADGQTEMGALHGFPLICSCVTRRMRLA
jgi:hypothetical protein